MFDPYAEQKARVIRALEDNRSPCLLCDADDVVGIGTWVPDKKRVLAAGGTAKGIRPVFGYWLCRKHAAANEQNRKLIQQAVIRAVRSGSSREL